MRTFILFTGLSLSLCIGLQAEQQMEQPTYLYLVLSTEEWESSQGQQHLKLSAHHDAFIHLATEQQVPKILDKFWSGKECVILKVETDRIHGKLVYEKNPGGDNKYYHLYEGFIPPDAIVSTARCHDEN